MKIPGSEFQTRMNKLRSRVAEDGLGYRWNAKKYPAGKEKEVLQKILTELK